MTRASETFGAVALRAAQGGDLTRLLAFMEQGADLDAPDRQGLTALARAAQYDRPDMVKALLAAGADPNAPCEWGLTPLLGAKSMTVAEALVKAGSDVNARAGEGVGLVTLHKWGTMEAGQTALMKAAERGDLPVVGLLLSHGAAIDVRDADRLGALAHASARGNVEVAEALMVAGASVGLAEAALLGDVRQMRGVLVAGADLSPETTEAALWWAAGGGDCEAVSLLLGTGVSVDAYTFRGRTALIHAALMGQAEAVRILIAHGADVNAFDERATSIHPSLSSLVGIRAEVSRFIMTGGTALIEAVLQGEAECARILIANGSDLEMSSGIDLDGTGGWTALQAAVMSGRVEIVRLLVDGGADVNNAGLNDEGRVDATPLAMAQRRSLVDIAEVLAASGANPGDEDV